MINVSRLRIPLSILTQNENFIVVNQSMIAKYEGGKATGEYDGVKLELFDASLLDRIVVKIPGITLPFDQAKVDGQEIQISLVNPTWAPYVASNGQMAISIKADSFNVLNKK